MWGGPWPAGGGLSNGTVIVGCDTIAQLEENIEIARTFMPITEAQIADLHERTAPIARECLWFRRGA